MRFVWASRPAARPARPGWWKPAISPRLQPLSLGHRSGMPYPDRFYPVVDSLAWVARLTKLGVGTIQLRAKNLDDAQSLQIVSDALEVTKGTPTKLVVNDHWRAADHSAARPL